MSVWNLGSARGPFTVKKRPLFDENTFSLSGLYARRIALQIRSCGARNLLGLLEGPLCGTSRRSCHKARRWWPLVDVEALPCQPFPH